MPAEINISPLLGERLGKLYDDNFKHGSYQMPPEYLLPYIDAPKLNYKWRDTRPRIEVLLSEISSGSDVPIVEIGANSGFQSLRLAKAFPKRTIIAVEGNADHASFISLCAEVEELENVQVFAEYATPKDLAVHAPGAIFLDFNVVHHMGVDFNQDSILSVEDWWDSGIYEWLSSISKFSEYWFSAGFMWGGNKQFPLHDINDPAGFYERILNSIQTPSDSHTKYWTFGANSESSRMPVKAMPTQFNDVNQSTMKAVAEEAFVGEYFRRPLLRVATK